MEPKQSILNPDMGRMLPSPRDPAVIMGGGAVAIPTIKTGYRLLQVDSADTASQIVFAGVALYSGRGLLVLPVYITSKRKRPMLPDRADSDRCSCSGVVLAQTFVQVNFFF